MTAKPTTPMSTPQRLMLAGACTILLAAGLAMALPFSPYPLTEIYFFDQDVPVLIGIAAALAGLAFLPDGLAWPLKPRHALTIVLTVAALVALIAVLGHWLVFAGQPLTRDEVMVEFDARIFRAGALVARVPEAWRAFVPALQPAFLFGVEGHEAWLSAYLPGNAALHALLGAAAAPLLAAGSVVLAYACARRLWPAREDLGLLAGLLIATSPQVLMTAMTPYAATAHLTLNLLWLWLFLRSGTAAHAAALLTGFIAVGLHQLVFHPMFVAPFVAMLWLQRRWSLALTYTIAYGAICLFWLFYWRLVMAAEGLGPDVQDASDLVARAALLLDDFTWQGLSLMLKNALRFLGWTDIVLLPLIALAVLRARTWQAELWALATGVLLTTVVVFILLPYQGHGWGYRYWHQLLGNFVLIAVAGYATIPGLWSKVVIGTLVTFCLLLPWRAVQTRAFVAPYATALRTIAAMPQPFVIIDRSDRLFTADLVRNDPFLRNKSLTFDLSGLDDTLVRRLCAKGPVGYFGPQQAEAAKIPAGPNEPVSEARRAKLRALLKEINCGQ